MLVRWPQRDARDNIIPINNPVVAVKRRDRNRAVDYFHSTFVDVVLGYLCGIRPQPDDSIIVSPLANEAFAVGRLWYHNCVSISILYDPTGNVFDVSSKLRDLGLAAGARLHKGLFVFIDGLLSASSRRGRPLRVKLPGHCSQHQNSQHTISNHRH